MSETKPKILVAEDNLGIARVLSYKLKSCGYHPISCGDGQSAWEAFQNEDVVAVISDQEMPRLTGLELCRKIREIDSCLPIFLVTGRQLELKSSGATDGLGINGVFSKPFSPATVLQAIDEAIESSVKKPGATLL